MVKIDMLSVRTRVLNPIFLAVSSLSPVKTQSFMPASLSTSMVSSTFSCSLSSIAVIPTSFKSHSTRSAAAANCCSRLSMAFWAVSKAILKVSQSSSLSGRLPKTRVLKPCEENFRRCGSSQSSTLAALAIMTLSAPFTRTTRSPLSGLSATTDWRFLAEVKALRAWIVYIRVSSLFVFGSRTSTDNWCLSRSWKVQPASAAAETKADSSGLSAS
mmetsp:Transcript_23389/g.49879  ORF Transcript_23389/g.49879 Transcript_23389/m.49879 type:complete len:215 (+) Transcript_23389:2731-3375(+)